MKKAYVEGDLVAIVIVILLLLFLAAGLSQLQGSSLRIQATRTDVNDRLFLVNLMRTPYSGGWVQDVVMQGYADKDFSQSRAVIDHVLEEAFGEPVCWSIFIETYHFGREDACTTMQDLGIGDVDVSIPLPHNKGGEVEIMEVRLRS